MIFFKELTDHYIQERDVTLGKMMSAPALKYNNKVFLFANKNEMGFRLGKEFNPHLLQIKQFQLLSPFKTKPPLKDWFIFDILSTDKWFELAELALEFTKSKYKK